MTDPPSERGGIVGPDDASAMGPDAAIPPSPEEITPPVEGAGNDGDLEQGADENDLDADNAVEADSIETVDPDNAPA